MSPEKEELCSVSLEQQGITTVCESGLTCSGLVFVKFPGSSMESGEGDGLQNECGETRPRAQTMLQGPPTTDGHPVFSRLYPQGMRMTTIWGRICVPGTELKTGAYSIYTFQRKPKRLEVNSTLPVLAQLVGANSQSQTLPSLLNPHAD